MKYISTILIFILLSSTLKCQEDLKCTLILRKDLNEYQVVQSDSLNTYLFNVIDSDNREKIYILPNAGVGWSGKKISSVFKDNLPDIYVEGDTLFFHKVGFTMSIQNIGVKNYYSYILKLHKNELMEYTQNVKIERVNEITSIHGVRDNNKIVSTNYVLTPLTLLLSNVESSNIDNCSNESIHYSYIRSDGKNIMLVNWNGILYHFSLGDNWAEVKNRPFKDEKEYPSLVEHWWDNQFKMNWDLDFEVPFPNGPIRGFVEKRKLYVLDINSNKVFNLKDKQLEKMNEFPESLSQDTTLILDQDADEVYLSPQINNYKKGDWCKDAVRIIDQNTSKQK